MTVRRGYNRVWNTLANEGKGGMVETPTITCDAAVEREQVMWDHEFMQQVRRHLLEGNRGNVPFQKDLSKGLLDL